jgi:drug/metabolite transporter (DMT)-like permease
MNKPAKQLILAHLAVIVANMIYGVNYVVAKGIMPDYLLPRTVILFRVAGAALIFWIVGRFFKRPVIVKSDMIRLAVASFFGIALNQIMFFEGLNLTTPINASIIMVSVPILVLVASGIILKERMTMNRITGVILGFSGATLLILHGGVFDFSSGTFFGNLFILINAASYGTFLVLIKPLMSKYEPVVIMKWLFTFGLIYVTPVSFYLLDEADYATIPLNIWLSVLYVIIFTTVIAYFLNNYSLKKISPTMNSTYIYLQPFLATVVSLIIGQDKLGWTEVIAAGLIFTGVYFVSRRKKILVPIKTEI